MENNDEKLSVHLDGEVATTSALLVRGPLPINTIGFDNGNGFAIEVDDTGKVSTKNVTTVDRVSVEIWKLLGRLGAAPLSDHTLLEKKVLEVADLVELVDGLVVMGAQARCIDNAKAALTEGLKGLCDMAKWIRKER